MGNPTIYKGNPTVEGNNIFLNRKFQHSYSRFCVIFKITLIWLQSVTKRQEKQNKHNLRHITEACDALYESSCPKYSINTSGGKKGTTILFFRKGNDITMKPTKQCSL